MKLVVRCSLFILLALSSCASIDPPLPDSYPRDAARWIEIDGTMIHYFDFNPDAAGTPLLYVHGYSGCAFEANYFQDDMGPDYRIIAADLPSSGLSDKPEIEYTIDYFVDFVHKFVNALGLERVHLIGHSLGGHIATVFAARYPELIERMVLIAPYGLDGEAGAILTFLSNAGVFVDLTFTLHSKTFLRIGTELNVYHDKSRIPQDLIDYLAIATFHTDNGVGALASITRHTIGHDPTDDLLPQIAVPTLIIWGRHDRLLPFRYSGEFAALIAGSDLVPIDRSGHLPQVEQQELTAAAIAEFLTR